MAPITWDELVVREPCLEDLEDVATRLAGLGSTFWGDWIAVRNLMSGLVGWYSASAEAHPELSTNVAYEVAYRHLCWL